MSIAALAAVAFAGLIGCRLPEPPPVNARSIQALERESAAGTRFERLPPLPASDYYMNRDDRDDPRNYDPGPRIRGESARGTAVTTGEPTNLAYQGIGATTQPATRPTTSPATPQVVGIPLREAIRRATLNNFDVAVAGYDPGIAETRVVEALARFDPTFQLTGEYRDEAAFNPNQSQFGDTQTLTLSTALSQLLPSGGEARLEYRAIRTNFENPPVFFSPDTPNPSWTSELTLQVTQPLLRDFGFDVNRARIFINQNDQRISVLDFRTRLEEVLLETERTYWQLYQAQRRVEIERELLRRTQETARRILDREDQDATRDQISQALGSTKQRAAALISAQTQVAQLSDQLKRLMNDPTLPVTSPILVQTATEPVTQPLLFDLDDAVGVALVSRPELSQQLVRINSAGRAMRVAESNRLPRLDAILRGGFGGFGGGFDDAVDEQVGLDNPVVGIGLQLEIPIGNRAARSVLQRAKMQREQAVTQYQALVQQVSLEVKQAQRAVSDNYSQLIQLREAYLAFRDAVETLTELQAAGQPLTPEFSDRELRFLEQAAQARTLEVQALAQYNLAIAEYERAKGTLLRYNNITLEEAARQAQLPVGRQETSGRPRR